MFLKKPEKGDLQWSMKKMVLGWAIYTHHQILTLPIGSGDKLADAIAAITNQPEIFSEKKWYRLIVILSRAVPEISAAEGMPSRLQHALKTANSRRVKLTLHVNDGLNLWIHSVDSLGDKTTHLRDIRPRPPTWTGSTYDYLILMGGICSSPKVD